MKRKMLRWRDLHADPESAFAFCAQAQEHSCEWRTGVVDAGTMRKRKEVFCVPCMWGFKKC